MTRIYIAGPMTGHADFNYPAFNCAAAKLRAIGYEVENPAENPDQPTWQHYMRLAVRQLASCDAVALLPGWETSRGAKEEFRLAQVLGIECKPLMDWLLAECVR
jgi:hypothetical protein